MAFSTFVALAVFSIASIAAAAQLQDSIHMKKPVCGEMCRFRWCRTDENSTLAPSGRVLNLRRDMLVTNPYVCLADNSMARVLKTGATKLQNADGTFSPLDSTMYSPRFFSTATIPGLVVGGARRSGLKMASASEAQFQALDDKCVILPIRKFERYDPTTETVTGRSGELSSDRDCVSFSSVAPMLHVSLFWESSDDLDLTVREPNGNVLSRTSQKTATGRFTNDNGSGACAPARVHNEAAVYRRAQGPPQTGTYTVTVKMSRNCDPTKRIRYSLRVYQEGVPIFQKRSFTRAGDGSVVFTTTFTY